MLGVSNMSLGGTGADTGPTVLSSAPPPGAILLDRAGALAQQQSSPPSVPLLHQQQQQCSAPSNNASNVGSSAQQLLSVPPGLPSHLPSPQQQNNVCGSPSTNSHPVPNQSAPVTAPPAPPPLLSTNTAPVTNLRDAGAAAGLALQQQQHHHQTPAQPVEFNHAINYVNKIKMRFHTQPDIYKQFLEILHTYQKEQRSIKDGSGVQSRPGTLTEKEVYEKVARLFENQKDLLQEFSQFLPDATSSTVTQATVSEYYLDCSRTHPIQPSSVKPGLDHPAINTPAKKSSVVGNLSTSVLKSGNASSPVSPHANNVLDRSNSSSNSSLPAITNKNLVSPQHSPSNHSGLGSSGSANLYSPNGSNQLKRSSSSTHPNQPPVKKIKPAYLKDVSLADTASYASLQEIHFFDQVRKNIKCKQSYNNFLRCITLYNEEIISRSELLILALPFLQKHPNLSKWFEDFINGTSVANSSSGPPHEVVMGGSMSSKQERMAERETELDLGSSKRIGASYCSVPPYWSTVCSGRTSLCDEVLNDHWVSFPSWSEDATFVSSKKTTFEEYIYRCEDERFELDVVIETNLSTTRVLEGVLRKMNKMSAEEASRFKLDDSLGGNSPTIHQRAIRRIYGDKASDIIDGLKKNPLVAVPLVLRRLKLKDEEWREAQKNFNKMWREQIDKYYYKSLDHQGINFKQNDIKMLRSKSLLNDIETLFDEVRHFLT